MSKGHLWKQDIFKNATKEVQYLENTAPNCQISQRVPIPMPLLGDPSTAEHQRPTPSLWPGEREKRRGKLLVKEASCSSDMMKDMKVKLCEIYVKFMICCASWVVWKPRKPPMINVYQNLLGRTAFYVGTVQLSKTVPSLAKKNQSCRLAWKTLM